MNETETPRYYVPHSSAWPIIGSITLFITAFGAAHFIQQSTPKVLTATGTFGAPIFYIGLAATALMMFGWFRAVVRESLKGLVSNQLDRTYRQTMLWFILSELMFFAAFFGALFYARMISVPALAGAGSKLETHIHLWPDFADTWPHFMTPGGTATEAMAAWGLPFINTVILVTSIGRSKESATSVTNLARDYRAVGSDISCFTGCRVSRSLRSFRTDHGLRNLWFDVFHVNRISWGSCHDGDGYVGDYVVAGTQGSLHAKESLRFRGR